MHRSVFGQSAVRGNAEKGIEKNERACYNQNKGAICAKEDKMKKLLATFAVTALLVILAVSAVSCVYLPDGDRTIDYGALGEPVFAGEYGSGDPSNPDNEFTWGGEIASNEGGNDFVSQFVIDYVRVYETDGIPFVK